MQDCFGKLPLPNLEYHHSRLLTLFVTGSGIGTYHLRGLGRPWLNWQITREGIRLGGLSVFKSMFSLRIFYFFCLFFMMSKIKCYQQKPKAKRKTSKNGLLFCVSRKLAKKYNRIIDYTNFLEKVAWIGLGFRGSELKFCPLLMHFCPTSGTLKRSSGGDATL